MANYNGLLNAAAPPDQFPDTNKPAADIFQQFGILTPSEKAAEQAKQQMALQMFQQQQDLQRRQLATQQAQLSNGPGYSTLLALGGTRNVQPQQGGGLFSNAMQQSQSGPEPSQVLSQEVAAAGGDPIQGAKRAGAKLLQMGQQTGNQDLAKLGINMLVKAREKELAQQKEISGIASTQASTTDTQLQSADRIRKAGNEQASLGNPGTPFQGHAPNGDMVSMAPQFDKQGVFTGYGVITKGPNKQITQTIDDPRTQSQKGEDFKEFRLFAENSDTTIAKIKEVKANLKAGAAQGWGASAVTLVDNLKGTLGQFTSTAELDESANKALTQNQGTFASWATKTGVNEAVWSDLVSSLAKTYNPTGTITEKDIVRASKVVGQNLSNPQTVVNVLDDVSKNTNQAVDRKYAYLSPDAKEAAKSMLSTYKDRSRDWVDNPPKTKADYDRIPSGTEYYNPSLKKKVVKK